MLRFPQCLTFLTALNEQPEFRLKLETMPVVDSIHQQQALHWMHEARDVELYARMIAEDAAVGADSEKAQEQEMEV
jgi:hypothetical protein